MKIVFICNKDYKDKLTRPNDGKGFDFCGVHISFEKEHEKTEEEWGNEEYIKRIASVNEFDPDLINSFFSDGDFRQNQVFVMPELLWSDCSVDEGYEMALQLLKRLKDKPFVLRFISNFTQVQLLHLVNKKYHSMVETFPHICINDVAEGHWKRTLKPLKPEEYSATHFQLIRNIAISHWGRLEYIEHQLKPRNNNCSAELKEHFVKLLSELDDDAYRFDGSGERIKQLMEEVISTCPPEEASDDEKSEYANTVVSNIQPLITTIRRMLHTIEGKQGHQKPGKLPYQVLVIDDDEKERKDLCEFFGTYYEHVACNDDGSTFEIADVQAAKDWMEKHANEYHIIILDLLFMGKDNIWMPYSGLDLLKLIPSYCTVRVITRLPRQRVGEIAKTAGIKLDAGQILTKSIGWKQLEGCLYDRRDEINKECKKNEKQRTKAEDLRMPARGFFEKQLVRDFYRGLVNYNPNKITTLFEIAIDKLRQGKPITLLGNSNSVSSIKNDKELEEYFINYLAHRRAFLEWVVELPKANPLFKKEGIGIESYSKCVDNQIINTKIDPGYINGIGFRRNTIPDKYDNNTKRTIIYFPIQELFPFELDYYVEKTKTTELSDEVSLWSFIIQESFETDRNISVRDSFKEFKKAKLDKCLSYSHIITLLTDLLDAARVKAGIKNSLKKLFEIEWFDYDKLESDQEINGIISSIKLFLNCNEGI